MNCKHCGSSRVRRSLGEDWQYSCPWTPPPNWVEIGKWRWYRCSSCNRHCILARKESGMVFCGIEVLIGIVVGVKLALTWLARKIWRDSDDELQEQAEA